MQARGQRPIRIGEYGADVRHDVTGANWDRDPKFAQQPTQGLQSGRPGPHPRGSNAMEGRDGLLGRRLHRHWVDLVVARGLKQGFRIGPVRLVPPHIPADVVRREQSYRMSYLLKRPAPVVRRPAGCQEHRRRGPNREEGQEPRPAQPMLFVDSPRSMLDGYVKDRLCEVDGDGRLLHEGSSWLWPLEAASSLPR